LQKVQLTGRKADFDKKYPKDLMGILPCFRTQGSKCYPFYVTLTPFQPQGTSIKPRKKPQNCYENVILSFTTKVLSLSTTKGREKSIENMGRTVTTVLSFTHAISGMIVTKPPKVPNIYLLALPTKSKVQCRFPLMSWGHHHQNSGSQRSGFISIL
jgi:hypothetical protein